MEVSHRCCRSFRGVLKKDDYQLKTIYKCSGSSGDRFYNARMARFIITDVLQRRVRGVRRV